MTFEEWFSNLNDDEPVVLKDLLETCWHDAVIEGRNIQIFKDDAERLNEFDPDWDETLELVEEIKRLAIENERLRHGEIKYEDWEFNPMTGESLWGKQPVRTKDLTDAEIADALYGKGCWRLGVHPDHLREYRRVIQADREKNK